MRVSFCDPSVRRTDGTAAAAAIASDNVCHRSKPSEKGSGTRGPVPSREDEAQAERFPSSPLPSSTTDDTHGRKKHPFYVSLSLLSLTTSSFCGKSFSSGRLRAP